MWYKIKIWMLQWNSCRQKSDVLSTIQGLRKLVKTDSVCICFVTKHHYTALPWFLFSLFYILLFSVHIVNVNAAKSGTVLENSSVNIYTYIYIYTFFFLKSLSLTRFLILPKLCVFNRWELGSPMTCVLMISSLRLLACFIYDKRA